MSVAGPIDPLSEHYDRLTKALLNGDVVPLLGAGVNRCGRPAGIQPRILDRAHPDLRRRPASRARRHIEPARDYERCDVVRAIAANGAFRRERQRQLHAMPRSAMTVEVISRPTSGRRQFIRHAEEVSLYWITRA